MEDGININGRMDIEFIGGKTVKIFVKQVWVDTMGHPLVIQDLDDAYYNWENIISITPDKRMD